MKKNIKKINKQQRGFTLLETLVAIFILTLSITGPVYIASVAFRNTIDSRDNISAQYIAEEIIEVVKNKRDTNSLSLSPEPDWTTYIFESGINCLNETGGPISNKCVMTKDVNVGDYIFQNCPDATCPNISFDPASTDVVYGSSDITTTSKFIREFYLEKETEEGGVVRGVKITVNIIWNDKGRNKVYTLTERLYNINYTQFFNSN